MKKNSILAAWTMVEHLSEGDIKKNDKKLRPLAEAADGDYHSHFSHLLADAVNSRKISQNKGGFVIYFDIFSFQEVIQILRSKYRLRQTFEELRIGEKFVAAVYFDTHLVLKSDMTFFTASGYIRSEGSVPEDSAFHNFEENLKNELAQLFDESENDPEKFNAAVSTMLQKLRTSAESCRFQLLKNVETDATNLHSFFIDDLKKAANAEHDILHEYLYGFAGERVDLDSKSDSGKFHPQAFSSILQPKNFPSGRFPSKTAFALSLMQQAAVNLASGADTRKIRSVNGPPGTGKTTLLKDIFAELVVAQTIRILDLKEHTLKGTSETVYYNQLSIAELPEAIAENGIIVASSNNGAVKNIVDELPKISEIDEALLPELKKADYFWELSNQKLSMEWDDNKKVVLSSEPMEKEQFWGLFSLEGGRSENMKQILTCLRHIHKFLREEYEPDPGAYDAFKTQLQTVRQLRTDTQKLAKLYPAYRKKCADLDHLRRAFDSEALVMQKNTSTQIQSLNTECSACAEEINSVKQQLEASLNKQKQLKETKEQLNACLSSIQQQKPGLIARLFGKRLSPEAQNTLNEVTKKLLELSSEELQCQSETEAFQKTLRTLEQKTEQHQKEIHTSQQNLKDWFAAKEKQISKLEAEVSTIERSISAFGLKPLDMSVDYETLQLSDPWFGENYRIAQSELFIAALRLRKQFLYENRNNLMAAINIWNSQNKYLDRKRLICAAWNWINFTIPVISSTFASFSRMCRNLDVGTLGHLFVDEAGQAVPQAAVGAIMRSKYVMVVGDPSQIKPVLTLDSSILAMLSSHFGVTEKYLSDSASVQTLADAASKFGFYRTQEKTEDSWIGIPLWVHRRCQYPMFSISNEISYQNLMVQGKKEYGKTGWFSVNGRATDKYVREQGEFLKQKIKSMIEENPEINDKNKADTIYVISPFSNVAYQLSRVLNEIHFTRYDKQNKPTNVGTIHTFQGKEAPIVFLVLGADSQSKGAASWAVNEPNMMNVAATRAKKEFYIIGDKALYASLGSDVIDSTLAIIRSYGAEHPELIDSSTQVTCSETETQINEAAAIAPKTEDSTNEAVADHSESEIRITGTIQKVGTGRRTKYAYVTGCDGEKYIVNETTYAATAHAETLICENAVISFVPVLKGTRLYAEQIEEA